MELLLKGGKSIRSEDARYGSTYDQHVTIAAGGIHASLYPEQTLNALAADVVAIGNADDTIAAIVEAHTSKAFREIPCVAFRSPSGLVELTSGNKALGNLDDLPFPARHLLDRQDFIMNDRLSGTDAVMAHIMLSRGELEFAYEQIRQFVNDNWPEEVTPIEPSRLA